MKEIKDYLHLYLGCGVEYPDTANKKVIAILTGFSKQDGVETTYKRKRKKCVGDYLAWKDNGNHKCNAFNIKLILRPLSDMTEEEAREVLEVPGSDDIYHKGSIVYCFDSERTRWALSKHFDLFGLIPEGLAIDATTLKK